MNRRNILKIFGLAGISVFGTSFDSSPFAKTTNNKLQNDREYWVSLLQEIASPILENISRGTLRKNMPMSVSPNFDNRDSGVGYLEAFGRLIAGMAPWLSLPFDETKEGLLRKKMTEQVLLGIQMGVDSISSDYFSWRANTKQPLVDAAFLVQGILRAQKTLWEPLPAETKKGLIGEIKSLRRIKPNESNWLLFAAMTETFLYTVGEDFLKERIDYAVNKFDKEWYVGDGWYSDGSDFSFDYYNGFVIHCMQVEVLKYMLPYDKEYEELYKRAYLRMRRFANHLERLISPEGTFPVFGRSSTYRNAVFQPLAAVALDKQLPAGVSPAQVRSALTAVLKNIFVKNTINRSGWLEIGFVGNKQQQLADYYITAGSMYMVSLSFLPLGLPAVDEFWTAPSEMWTAKKAFLGLPILKDSHLKE